MSPTPALLLNTEPALRRGWHPVCASADLDESPRRFRLLGCTWELARRHTGEPVVTASDGGPAYAVTDSMGHVWLAPEEPAAPLLDAPELDDPSYSSGWLTPKHTTASAALYLDNQLDASHFPFVHVTTFGDETDPRVPTYAVERTPGGFTASVAHAFRNVLDPGVATGERPVEQVRRVSYRFALPLQLQLRIDHLQTGQRTVILFGTCPRDEDSTQLWVRILRNDIPGHPGLAAATMPEVLEFENRVVAEDLALQEKFDIAGLPLDTALELPVRADQCGLELRKLLRQLCADRVKPSVRQVTELALAY